MCSVHSRFGAFNDRRNCSLPNGIHNTYVDVIEGVAEEIDRRRQFDDFEFIFTIFQSDGFVEFVKFTDFDCTTEMLCAEHETRDKNNPLRNIHFRIFRLKFNSSLSKSSSRVIILIKLSVNTFK